MQRDHEETQRTAGSGLLERPSKSYLIQYTALLTRNPTDMAVHLTEADDFNAILAEQRRELAAAQAVDSDSEYAFQLQMQEIANASASLPSASSSQPPPANADVSATSPDVLSFSSAAVVMLEEMERYALERNDREQCMAEFKRMREDLDRRVYDQKFAAEITTIPEGEWQNYGDNYHKPYEAGGSSSSSSSGVSECFRVYSKGLVSEEYFRDRKIPVVGIGVAICDFKDNVVLEIKKPWIEGGLVSELEAEIQAIVQGLDAALCLDLKRVTFFVNDNCLYYVTGQKSHGCSKVMALVNQASVLRRKFTQCEPSLLLGPNFVKFAFKLARDAIVAQISWPEETPFGMKRKETCAICFEDTDVSNMFSIDQCLHRYCLSCMKKHVEAKLHDGVAIQCPHDGCNSNIAIDSCEKFLEPNLVSIMSQRIKEVSVPATERVYCPYPRCSALMSEREVLEYSRTSFIGAEQSGARRCIRCQQFFCLFCRVPWHYNMSCTDFRSCNPNPAREDAKLKSLANEKRWRQCIKCNHMVELASGCYHITCRCGYEFCYTCGAMWKNKKPTCTCPIWDPRNIIRGWQ
ncbi:uncharacterized protein LOC116210601 [Punica granatum]|uniref:RBR-type E3 ubiquitin transferase n=1 Tax=Punica granatum TaxID=22663 RepID=A0A6P8E4P1_PUNGR|nr:uncharacterized protein LOC116210601 [Punica granatum]